MATGRRLRAPVLAALLLAACTPGSGPEAPTSGPATPASSSSGPVATTPPGASASGRGGGSGVAPASPRGSPSVPGTSSRLLYLTTTARIPLPGQTYGRGLVLWGRHAAWVGCDGCQRTFTEPTTLYAADLSTRRVRVVATAPRNGVVLPLGGSGTTLVYAVALGDTRSGQWTAYAVDVVDGRRSALATVTKPPQAVPPVATVGAGQLVWQTFGQGPDGDSHGPLTAVDLRTGARTTLARDLPGVLGAVTGTGLVYRAPTDPGTTVGQGLVDVFFLPDGGPQVRELSSTHDAAQVVADDTTAAWQTDNGPEAGVWAAPLDRQGTAREYYRGDTGDRAVGTGFLALVTSGDDPVLLLYPLAGGPVVAAGDVPGEFDSIAAEGSRLAYIALPDERGVQPDAKHPITLVVATVGLPGD